jgi:SAM-dependent methyltransferase
MWQDVVDLKDFYDREIGRTARHLLRLRIRALWPDLKGQRLLGLGYATPFLRQFLGEVERVAAVMPAAQGVMPWPREAPGMTLLADETELPFQDNSVDRVLLVHSLESSEHPGDMLGEVWRVLGGGGRLMVVVPNRRSLWSHLERTPFGHGQPFTQGQVTRLLRSHGFTPLTTERALLFWPFAWRAWLKAAPGWERIGRRWFTPFAGVIVIEAMKQLYGAQSAKPVKRRRAFEPIAMPAPATRGVAAFKEQI